LALYILEPSADESFGLLWRATAIGMMADNGAGRAGELARAYVIAAKRVRAFTAALASLVVDRVFDTLVVLLLLLTVVSCRSSHRRHGRWLADRTHPDRGRGVAIAALVISRSRRDVSERLVRLWERARSSRTSHHGRGRGILLSFGSDSASCATSGGPRSCFSGHS
jgi:hypothetical protein